MHAIPPISATVAAFTDVTRQIRQSDAESRMMRALNGLSRDNTAGDKLTENTWPSRSGTTGAPMAEAFIPINGIVEQNASPAIQSR